ncbi:MAG TPA: ABC transporter substrate-binding protein [Devosiaceae bacterium]
MCLSRRALLTGSGAAILLPGMAHAQPTAVKKPVRIGAIVDASADYDGAGLVLSIQMAIDDFGGSVLGRPVELLSADHQNKPDIGAGIARKWIAENDVQAFVGGANSAVGAAVQGLAGQSNRTYLNVQGISSDLSDKACTRTATHWGIDTYALARAIGTFVTASGGKTWFFITADYTFGHALQRDTERAIKAAGGTVIGQTYHPFNNADFSAQILAAQSSGADVIGFANSGPDFTNSLKQAYEFGLNKRKQQLVGLLTLISNVNELGLDVAQGIRFASLAEWNMTPEIRTWSERYMKHVPRGLPPVPGQILAYSATRHFLRSAAAAGATDGLAVARKMRELAIDDAAARGGTIRVDGRVMLPVHIRQVKAPSEVKYPYDYSKELGSVPAANAFRPLSELDFPQF